MADSPRPRTPLRTRWSVTGVVLLIVAILCAAVETATGAPAAAHHRSARNGRIAYSVGGILADPDLSGHSQIYTIRPNGTGRRQLTHVTGSTQAGDPAWSPNGHRIAYVSNASGTFQVWVMKADGSGQHRLVRDPGHDAFVPRWSPNGHRLLFTRCQPPGLYGVTDCAIATARADGSRVRTHTFGHWLESEADWSPNGHTILFDSNREGIESAIWRLNVKTNRLHRLTAPNTEAFFPSFRPGGRRVLFGNNGQRPHTSVYSMRPDGTDQRLVALAPQNTNWAFGRYSPDGRKIFFNDNNDDHSYLVVADANGSHKRRIVSTGNSQLIIADWGPRS